MRGPLAFCIPVVLAQALLSGGADSQELMTVRPVDTGEALINPAMGWVFHHFDNSIGGYGAPLGPAYDGREFPGLSVAYLRLAWSYLEPREGQFNWSVVDSVAQRYLAAGKRIAFRISCYEGDPSSEYQAYATPRWVRDAGAKGYELDGGCWEPDYDDPIYLAKLEAFLAAFGARYDGDPNVDFVDIGTLGIWGEGHPIGRGYSLGTAQRHIDLHRKYLPRTLLAVGDDFANWFGGEDLTEVRRSNVAVDFGIPETSRGLSYPVYAGLWIPGDPTRPNARLLPSNGDPDRRVPIGEVSVSATGEARFEPALPAPAEGGDYEIASVAFEQEGDRGVLRIEWEVRNAIHDNVQPFCHLDRDGKIALGGGRHGRDMAVIRYSRQQGLTLRDDSILVEPAPRAYFSHGMAQDFWPSLPVILESSHYGYAKDIGSWKDGEDYLRAVEDYHASYASIHANPHDFLAENRDLIRRMNLRLGYRLNLLEASWPAVAPRGGPLRLTSVWANAGVAPCYPGGFPTWWLFDAQGLLRAALVDDGLQVRDLAVGPVGEAPATTRERALPLPLDLAPGEYEVRVSVGDVTGSPTLALPLPGDDGHKRYALGTITLQ